MRKALRPGTMALLLPLWAGPGLAGGEVAAVRAFKAGPLVFSQVEFEPGSISKWCELAFWVANPSEAAHPFLPEDLAIVGADGVQGLMTYEALSSKLQLPPPKTLLAPGGRVFRRIRFAREVTMPVKLFYKDTLLTIFGQ